MNNYQVYLFDLDGTVYRGDQPIMSAIKYIEALIAQHKQIVMLTNNSTVNALKVKQKLAHFGLDTTNIAVITSALASAYILKKQGIRDVFVVGTDELKRCCWEAGLNVTSDEGQALLVGLDPQATYAKIAAASKFLQHQQVPFFATNNDLRLAANDHFLPGAGTLVAMIEQASGQTATILGKPFAPMIEYAQMHLQNDALDTWVMIGDNYDTDILFGIQQQIATCFVATGVHTLEHIKAQTQQPTYCCQTLTEVE